MLGTAIDLLVTSPVLDWVRPEIGSLIVPIVMVHNIKFKYEEVHKYAWHKDLYGTGSSKCVTVSADLL